jgi:ribosomal protein L37AE/L43A
MVTKICKNCGKEFEGKTNRVFCSIECSFAYDKKMREANYVNKYNVKEPQEPKINKPIRCPFCNHYHYEPISAYLYKCFCCQQSFSVNNGLAVTKDDLAKLGVVK